jgi:NADH-quinone oxidoreductase subunit G
VDAGAAWGVEHLPDAPGRDADAIVAALRSGELGGLVIGGVDPRDTADPAATRAAIEAASFVVSLELRETEVTRAADVVLPVAAVVEKAGTFVTWEGRPRPFEAVFASTNALPDLRVLAGIAQELAALGQGAPLGFRTVAEVRAEMEQMGPWDGRRPAISGPDAVPATRAAATARPASDGGAGGVDDGLLLASWRLMVDNGVMQDGDKAYRATGRTPVALVSPATHAALLERDPALADGAVVTGDRGSMSMPLAVAEDMVDGVVWVPGNSTLEGVLADLASPGSRVHVKGAAG